MGFISSACVLSSKLNKMNIDSDEELYRDVADEGHFYAHVVVACR